MEQNYERGNRNLERELDAIMAITPNPCVPSHLIGPLCERATTIVHSDVSAIRCRELVRELVEDAIARSIDWFRRFSGQSRRPHRRARGK
jgi:hypothetical protein